MTMPVPQVSILIPIYNGLEYLDECLSSVVAQTFRDWTALIGVNGHGESGGEVAARAQAWAARDSRIRVYVQPPPLKGKVESLNDLMNHVKTKWVCVLDCDDKWHPAKLAYQLEASRSTAAGAVVIGTLTQYFGESQGMPYVPQGYIDYRTFGRFNPIINSSALILAEYCVWEYMDPACPLEDYYLWMKIALKGRAFYNLPHILTYHRIHKTSAFNSKHYSDEALRTWYVLQCAAIEREELST
jgi:teichuronic acid biosynthesis glycosyltransferase TuaG